MSKDISDLRNHLFAALDGLADKDKPMEIERAKAIADVARVIVDSAKAETDLLKVTGRGTTTGFVPLAAVPPAPRRLGAAATGGCSFCGGRLVPETNGGGVVIDRCQDCGRSPTANGDGNGVNRITARGPAKV